MTNFITTLFFSFPFIVAIFLIGAQKTIAFILIFYNSYIDCFDFHTHFWCWFCHLWLILTPNSLIIFSSFYIDQTFNNLSHTSISPFPTPSNAYYIFWHLISLISPFPLHPMLNSPLVTPLSSTLKIHWCYSHDLPTQCDSISL